MASKQYYAHISQDGRKQTVFEHLCGTASIAKAHLMNIGLGKTAYLAGLIHDLGKFTDSFQEYLLKGEKKRGSVIHTFQGCRFFLEQSHSNNEEHDTECIYTAELLAFAVGAHHGLFDCFNEDGKSGLLYREEKENIFYEESLAAFYEENVTPESIKGLFNQSKNEVNNILYNIDNIYKKDSEYSFEIGLLARLLLSAVIDGDRCDTASFMNNTKQPCTYVDNMRPIWKKCLDYMESKLASFSNGSDVARARSKISYLCKEFAKQPNGIYRLNIPTGSGKTLSSLRYALAHAERFNNRRIIITSPLLSILEQNASVIREFIGNDDLILEHHSNVIQEEQSEEALAKNELMIQNWNSPIIITTLVQLLNCMFDGKTSSVRRFHALCNSIIIIDEVQTVPVKLLSLFNLTIRFLAEQCGSTIVLCSATQPCLEYVEHPIFPVPQEMITYDYNLWKPFLRTKIIPLKNHRLEDIPNLIISLMDNTQSLLVVCNKKIEAAYIFAKTKSEEYSSYHLSASMCMQHRRDTICELQESLKKKEKVLCVSTQVIEAGVDISFQQVARLTAGMDSIVQSAGRCNRNGEFGRKCEVYIVNCTDEKLGKLQDIQRGKTATIALLNEYSKENSDVSENLLSDESISSYYKYFYSDMDNESMDYPAPSVGTTIFDLLSENLKFLENGYENQIETFALRQAFKTAGQEFKVFNEDTLDVVVPYKSGMQLISQLSNINNTKNTELKNHLIKQASNYSISLYKYQKDKLYNDGALYSICDGAIIALQPQYYDAQLGLISSDQTLSFLEV